MKIGLLSLFSILFLTACNSNNSYTLYRNSIAGLNGEDMRLHIATFDTKDGRVIENYNKENCDIARGLFQNQPGVSVKYWCEKGSYKE